MTTEMSKFKQCPCCNQWLSAKDVLENPEIEVNGMAFDDDDNEMNVIFFTHRVTDCNSTFTIPVTQFEPFVTEPIPETIVFGSDQCEGRCNDRHDLNACNSNCRYAPYRRLLLKLIDAKKQDRPVRFAV